MPCFGACEFARIGGGANGTEAFLVICVGLASVGSLLSFVVSVASLVICFIILSFSVLSWLWAFSVSLFLEW